MFRACVIVLFIVAQLLALFATEARGESGVALLNIGDVPLCEPRPRYNIDVDEGGGQLLVEYFRDADTAVPVASISLMDNGTSFAVSSGSNEDGFWHFGTEKITPGSHRKSDHCFLKARPTSPTATSDARRNEMHFEDTYGNIVQPGLTLYTEGMNVPNLSFPVTCAFISELLVVDNGLKFSVCPMVRRFDYDPVKKRIGAAAGSGFVIYDIETGASHTLPPVDLASHAEVTYTLVPGRDALVVLKKQLDEREHNYVGMSLHLCDLHGIVLSDIPLTFKGSKGKVWVVGVAASKRLVAFVAEAADKAVLKVFVFKEEPQ